MIAGAGRSGSTLLERILATDPGMVTVGELTEIWQRGLIEDRPCGCGERFSACGFWADIGKRAFGGWGRVDPQRMIDLERKLGRRGVPLSLAAGISATRRRALDEYGAALTAIYRGAAESTGARVIIDASKWPRHLFVLRRIEIGLRTVHLFRDPRAVAYSWSPRATAEPQGGAGNGARTQTYSPAGSAVRWLAFNLLVDLAAKRGTPTRRIGYERLVENPTAVLGGLAADVGSTLESLAIDPDGSAVLLRPSHGIAGNPMRFRSGLVELDLDERWRTRMPTIQRLLVGAICRPLHRRYVRAAE